MNGTTEEYPGLSHYQMYWGMGLSITTSSSMRTTTFNKKVSTIRIEQRNWTPIISMWPIKLHTVPRLQKDNKSFSAMVEVWPKPRRSQTDSVIKLTTYGGTLSPMLVEKLVKLKIACIAVKVLLWTTAQFAIKELNPTSTTMLLCKLLEYKINWKKPANIASFQVLILMFAQNSQCLASGSRLNVLTLSIDSASPNI